MKASPLIAQSPAHSRPLPRMPAHALSALTAQHLAIVSKVFVATTIALRVFIATMCKQRVRVPKNVSAYDVKPAKTILIVEI